jgi:PLP dependent protein
MSIAGNLTFVRERIAASATRSGRDTSAVSLVAVSKTWPIADLAEAHDAGQTIFGENRVQELAEKCVALPHDITWHMIGPLQKNKARKALKAMHRLESLDSLDLARNISRLIGEMGLPPLSVLIQVNVARDAAKAGFTEQNLLAALPELFALPHLQIDGLMTIPSFDPDPEQSRCHFARLREYRDILQGSTGHPLPHLSMGMSHDYEVAIEEGATIVRVGSAIFGHR